MKRLKEKWLVFKKNHEKGLSVVNKVINGFIIALVVFLVVSFIIGGVKGCFDALDKESSDTEKISLVNRDVKKLNSYGDHQFFSFTTNNLFSSSKDIVSGSTCYAISNDSINNYFYLPTNIVSHSGNPVLTGSITSSYDISGESPKFSIVSYIRVISFNSSNLAVSFLPFKLDTSLSSLSFTVGNSVFNDTFSRVDDTTYNLLLTHDYLTGSFIKLSNFKLVFTSLPRSNCFVVFSCFFQDSDYMTDVVNFDDLALNLTNMEISIANNSNANQIFYKLSDESYDLGYANGRSEGYDLGYKNGSTTGFNDGYSFGYDVGKQDGLSGGNPDLNTLSGLFLTAFQSPFHLLQTIFNVDILGLNLSGLFIGLISIIIVLFIVKRFI